MKHIIATDTAVECVPLDKVACVTIHRSEPKARTFDLVIVYTPDYPCSPSTFTLAEANARSHLKRLTHRLLDIHQQGVAETTGVKVHKVEATYSDADVAMPPEANVTF